jgi:type III pantothenate kinase
MLLAIDIGNTLTKFGIFDNEKLISKFSIPTNRTDSFENLYSQISVNLSSLITSVIISSVVPELHQSYREFSLKIANSEPIMVDYNFGFEIVYENPETLGIDRAVAAFAAMGKHGSPCIVCDFGTATTIDVVNREGKFIGGIIVAGIGLLAESLVSRTSQLPKIELTKPKSVIGNSTISAIQSGTYFGYVSLVDGIIEKMFAETEKCPVIATGGFAGLINSGSTKIDILDENLMLDGLMLIHKQKAKKLKLQE